jgi:hypothetical protein
MVRLGAQEVVRRLLDADWVRDQDGALTKEADGRLARVSVDDVAIDITTVCLETK